MGHAGAASCSHERDIMIGNPVLRYLGFAATDRVVVIHADDLGMCEATLPAFVDLLAAGLVSSGSVIDRKSTRLNSSH